MLGRIYYLLRRIKFILKRLLPIKEHNLIGRVHPCDMMMKKFNESEILHYAKVGNEALEIIINALLIAGKDLCKVSILDFGCGYGRVTRALVRSFTPLQIDVFDVDNYASRFCAAEFGVNCIQFTGKWDASCFRSYDLIWVGSVFTHLSLHYTEKILLLLINILKPDGLLIFTTHGDEAILRLTKGFYRSDLSLYVDQIVREYREDGFSFRPYIYDLQKNTGTTWMSREFVERLMFRVGGEALTLLSFKPFGWDAHQDIYIFIKNLARNAR